MDSTSRVALVLTAHDKMSRLVNESVNKSINSIRKFQNSSNEIAKKSFTFGKNTLLGGAAIALPLYDFVKGAEEAKAAIAQFEKGAETMGTKATAAFKGAQKYAGDIMFKIGVDDEAIVAIQTKLGTFNNVMKNSQNSAETFNRATSAAFDLQAAGFGDASGNAAKLGKMLNNPIGQLNAMARAGVVFSKEEKKKIESLAKSGKLFEAQAVILDQIEKKVKGQAEAGAPATKKMAIAFGEVKESIGSALLPMIEKLANKISNEILPAFQKFISENGETIQKVLKVATVLGGLTIAVSAASFVFGGLASVVGFSTGVLKTATAGIKAYQAASALGAGGIKSMQFAMKAMNLTLLTSPFFWIAVVAVAAIAAIIYYWDDISKFFSRLWDGIKKVTKAAWDWMKSMFLNYTPGGLIIKHWDKISGVFTKIWSNVKAGFKATWDWLKNMFLSYTPAGLIFKHWDKISDFFSAMWMKVKFYFIYAIKYVLSLGVKFYEAGKNIVQSIWDGIKSLAMKPVEAIKNIVKSIRDFLPFSPAKTGPFKDLHKVRIVETIAQAIKPTSAVKSMQSTVAAIKAQIPVNIMKNISITGQSGSAFKTSNNFIRPSVSGGKSSSQITFAPVVNIQQGVGGGNITDQVFKALESQQTRFSRMLDERDRRRERKTY